MKTSIEQIQGFLSILMNFQAGKSVARLALISIFLAMGVPGSNILAQVHIVEDGEARAGIIIAEDPPRMVKVAAGELQTYIEKISGALLPVVTGPGGTFPVKIYLGQSPFTDSLGVIAEGLRYGAYRMISGQDYLVLLGDDFDFEPVGPVPLHPWPGSQPEAQRQWDEMTGSTWVNPMNRTYKSYHRNFGFWMYDRGGSLNAVYGFLRMLGARWYMPGELGEVIPVRTSIALPSVDTTVIPDFPMRYLYWSNYRTATWENAMWERRLGLNSTNEVLGAGVMAHGMRHVLGRDEMKRAHPEYYALRNGVRDTASGDRNHACFSSEGLTQETINYARSVMDHFGQPAVSIMPEDGYRQCECELCQGKNPSELVWTFVDRVSREVYKTHPDRWVTCGAYAQYKDPPGNILKFSPNVAVTIANCGRPFFQDPQRWSSYWEIVEGWQERIVPGNILRTENNRYNLKWGDDGYDDPIGFPVIHPHSMAKDLRALKGLSLGEKNEVSRANPGQVWKAPGLDHLNLYVQSRFFWDSGQDVDSLLDEYYSLFFGPASGQMKTAFDYAEANVGYAEDNFWCFINGPWRRSYCEGKMDLSIRNRFLDLLHTARDTAGETVYGQRIQTIIDELPTPAELLPEEKETATVTIIDRSTGEPVYRAEIQYGETIHATDYSGRIVIDGLEKGKWVFNIGHSAYFPLTDSLMFTGDTSLVVHLTRKLASIQFEVRDSSGPVPGATVSLNGWGILTDSDGMARFNNQVARHGYRYGIDAEGYRDIADSLFLEIDTTVTVILQLTTGAHASAFKEINVYPNPTAGELYIRTGSPDTRIILLSPEGKVLLERRLLGEKTGLDISGFDPGLYILRIMADEFTACRKVIIQQ
jgi:hypothetical protein